MSEHKYTIKQNKSLLVDIMATYNDEKYITEYVTHNEQITKAIKELFNLLGLNWFQKPKIYSPMNYPNPKEVWVSCIIDFPLLSSTRNSS